MDDYFSQSTGLPRQEQSDRSTLSTDPNASNELTLRHARSAGPLPFPASAGLQTPTLRLRRLPSSQALRQRYGAQYDGSRDPQPSGQSSQATRRRSSSEPQRGDIHQIADSERLNRQKTATGVNTDKPLPTVPEDTPHGTRDGGGDAQGREASTGAPNATRTAPPGANTEDRQRPGMISRATAAALRPLGRNPHNTHSDATQPEAQRQSHAEYDAQVVDMLDVIDPEVSTLSTLNNIQNSLYIPNLGRFYNRTPTYDLSRFHTAPSASSEESTPLAQRQKTTDSRIPQPAEPEKAVKDYSAEEESSDDERPGALQRLHTIQSKYDPDSENYAVLPHGVTLDGWTHEEKLELNDHVRHLLHSRKAKFKRSMSGFWKYFKTPVGFFVTLYSFLITFWGAAWVLFLIGWINVGNRQAYFVEICDQVLTALFCVVGIGLSPFRAKDTYHMIFIAKYGHMTWERRAKRNLPNLSDDNDLPEGREDEVNRDMFGADLEAAREKNVHEESVLTEKEQARFTHHQRKFAKSHTYYKPHETQTHRAFPLKLLIAVVVVLDFHSIFQMALGGTTWGIYYKRRPKALTAVILACSITCNITGGILISIGDKMSRKKVVVEEMFRQHLTKHAIEKVERRRKRREEEELTPQDSKTSQGKSSERRSQDKRRGTKEKILGKIGSAEDGVTRNDFAKNSRSESGNQSSASLGLFGKASDSSKSEEVIDQATETAKESR
ncbi:MAG: hypothetical protein M1831_004183 [Alyxoria varia]|nr:MAG: hypothetical protein M1831_004183 [Alyxoria varia]